MSHKSKKDLRNRWRKKWSQNWISRVNILILIPITVFFFRYVKGRDENTMCHTLRVNFLGIVFVLITSDLYRTLAMDPQWVRLSETQCVRLCVGLQPCRRLIGYAPVKNFSLNWKTKRLTSIRTPQRTNLTYTKMTTYTWLWESNTSTYRLVQRWKYQDTRLYSVRAERS